MDKTVETLIALVKPKDIVEIVPIDKVPNAERRFKVDEITEEGFLYGLSETCDGYVIPFYWIKELKIVSKGGK